VTLRQSASSGLSQSAAAGPLPSSSSSSSSAAPLHDRTPLYTLFPAAPIVRESEPEDYATPLSAFGSFITEPTDRPRNLWRMNLIPGLIHAIRTRQKVIEAPVEAASLRKCAQPTR